jgi:molecular chaperone GrpE
MEDVKAVGRDDAQEAAAGEAAGGMGPAEEQMESEVEALHKEIALLEDQLKTMRDRYVRAVADLDNNRKRARHEMAEAQVHAVAGVLLDVLAIVDNFERALETIAPGPEATPEMTAMYEGISLIYRQLTDMLARHGVRPIAAVGNAFDTRLHEAVVQVPVAEEEADGTVRLETQKGYLFGDRVLRPSRVGVAVRETPKEEKREGEGESG